MNTSSQNSRVGNTYKPESRVVLFGSESDPEVAAQIKKLKSQGREWALKPRPDFDTGQGICGKICHCKETCIHIVD